MYGKALALYIQKELKKRDYESPLVCCEDWGWWVEVRSGSFNSGICVYAKPIEENEALTEFACSDSNFSRKKWSWKKFGFVDLGSSIDKLNEDLITIFKEDKDINFIGLREDFPF